MLENLNYWLLILIIASIVSTIIISHVLLRYGPMQPELGLFLISIGMLIYWILSLSEYSVRLFTKGFNSTERIPALGGILSLVFLLALAGSSGYMLLTK